MTASVRRLAHICCRFYGMRASHISARCMQVLRLGNIVPDFTAMTTQGEIHWHDWIDGKWAILFSHPADFTCGFCRTCY